MGILKNICGVSSITLVSRLLGLIRDALMFRYFGAGAVTSAFVFGFTLPNLFRRLLGEGALNSALIPIFSQVFQCYGKNAALRLLNRVLSRLGLVILGIITLGIIVLKGLDSLPITADRYHLCFVFSMILLPYVFFVCIAAVLSAILNVFDRFLLAAGSSIWLNLAMIVAMSFIGDFFAEEYRIYCLCSGVLVGGIIQVFALFPSLRRKGWKFSWDFTTDESVQQFQKLFIPGFFGAAIVQINIALSRVLALIVSENAVSILYLANRLTELPLGMFVIAITTVVFPAISNAEAKGDMEKLRSAFGQGVRLILTIIFPATVGILFLEKSIVCVLFKRGNFGDAEVCATLPVLSIFVLSLVFYSLSTIFVKGFHSKKNTILPLKISIANFFINTGFTLLLMFPFQAKGIALANLASVMIQTFLLYYFLRKNYSEFSINWNGGWFLRIIVGCVMMLVGLIGVDRFLVLWFSGRQLDLLRLIFEIPLGVVVYFGTIIGLKGKYAMEIRSQMKKIFKKR